MRRIVFVAVPLVWIFSLSAAHAELFSACAWNKVASQVHKEFIVEFFKSPHEGDAVLYKYKDKLIQLATACAGRGDMSANFIMNAIFDQAAMEGAAAEVKSSMGIDRAQLDLVWLKEVDAGMCLVKDAAQDYRDITFADDVCPHDNASKKFLRRFKISSKTDEPDAYRLMRYFIAKARAQLDEMVLDAHSEPHPPSTPPARPQTP
jgi:hypothetical protein